jgi:hypothetical protein
VIAFPGIVIPDLFDCEVHTEFIYRCCFSLVLLHTSTITRWNLTLFVTMRVLVCLQDIHNTRRHYDSLSIHHSHIQPQLKAQILPTLWPTGMPERIKTSLTTDYSSKLANTAHALKSYDDWRPPFLLHITNYNLPHRLYPSCTAWGDQEVRVCMSSQIAHYGCITEALWPWTHLTV